MIITQKLYKDKIIINFDEEKHDYRIEKIRKVGSTTIIGIIDKSGALIPWAVDSALDYVREHKDKLMLPGNEVLLLAREEAERLKNKAADLGSQIHGWIEDFVKGKQPEMPVDTKVLQGVVSFLEWQEAHNVKFLTSERIVYSQAHDYIGTLDAEIEINGERFVLDIKTSNNLYPEVGLQIASYLKADVEESGREYKGRWALRISKETEEEYNAKMDKKNKTRIERGQKAFPYPPYRVFEALYLDNDPEALEKDFNGFLNALALYRWKSDAEKRFRALKKGEAEVG